MCIVIIICESTNVSCKSVEKGRLLRVTGTLFVRDEPGTDIIMVCPRLAGVLGKTGATGKRGFSGATGLTGREGLTGGTGKAGRSGSTGPVGPIGASGREGRTGATGVRGKAGGHINTSLKFNSIQFNFIHKNLIRLHKNHNIAYCYNVRWL